MNSTALKKYNSTLFLKEYNHRQKDQRIILPLTQLLYLKADLMHGAVDSSI